MLLNGIKDTQTTNGKMIESHKTLLCSLPYYGDDTSIDDYFSFLKRIESECIESWNLSILLFIFQHAQLNFADNCKPESQSIQPFTLGENIERLCTIGNWLLCKMSIKSVSTTEFGNMTKEVIAISRDLFGEEAESEIKETLQSEMASTFSQDFQNKMDHEIEVNNECNVFLQWQQLMKKNIGNCSAPLYGSFFNCNSEFFK